jgi:rhodanese-related sulfurtransferase
MMLIDVRTLEEFGTTSSLGAINIPLNELEQRLDEIDFSSLVITICQTGARSVSAALLLLKENSQRKIFSLHGGLSLGK